MIRFATLAQAISNTKNTIAKQICKAELPDCCSISSASVLTLTPRPALVPAYSFSRDACNPVIELIALATLTPGFNRPTGRRKRVSRAILCAGVNVSGVKICASPIGMYWKRSGITPTIVVGISSSITVRPRTLESDEKWSRHNAWLRIATWS